MANGVFAPGTSGFATRKKEGSGVSFTDILTGPAHFGEHLGMDVLKATTGFIPGLVQLAKDPIDSTKLIAEGIAHDWAPLFTGHPEEFARNFYEHPLGPILDVAAIFTGGAAGAGRLARGVSTARYTTRAGGSLGKRTIAYAPQQKGQFQIAIPEPTRIDRLAAYSREGRRKITRKDVVGAPGRKNVGPHARPDVIFYTPAHPLGKYRVEQWDKLVENFATRGGTLGKFAQMSYEMRDLSRRAGSVAALTWQMGELTRILERNYDKTQGFKRHNDLKGFTREWWDRLAMHGVATDRFVEVGQKYNKVTQRPLAKPSNLYKPHGGRGFGSGGVDKAIEDFAKLGERLGSIKNAQVFTGRELIERYGADATKIDAKKNYHILTDKHTNRAMGIDGGRSMNAIHKMFLRTTSMWKTIMLGFTPRFFVNNYVGNGLMFMMNHGGPSAILAYREAIRQLKGEKAMHNADLDLARQLKRLSAEGWMQQFFGDQIGQSLHRASLAENQALAKAARGTALEDPGYELGRTGTRVERAAQKGASKMFGAAGKWAEQVYRRAIIVTLLRKDPKMRAEMNRLKKKHPTWGRERLINTAAPIVLRKNPEIHQMIRQEVENTMGNYVALTKGEQTLREISPFYTWQRHILRNSFSMALDRPIRTAIAARAGEMGGDQALASLGGEAPEWMRAFLPLGETGRDGRVSIINTGGANPWAQAGELAEAGASVSGMISGGETTPLGATVGSLLNPLVVGGVQALGGSRLLTGQPMSPRESLLSPATSLPQFQMLKAAAFPDQFKEPTLYKRNVAEATAAWLGIPWKDMYLQRARQLGKSEAERRERGY